MCFIVNEIIFYSLYSVTIENCNNLVTPGADSTITSVIFPTKQEERKKAPNLLSHTFQVVDSPIHKKTEENIYALCPVKRLSPYLERLSGQEHHGMDRSLLN